MFSEAVKCKMNLLTLLFITNKPELIKLQLAYLEKELELYKYQIIVSCPFDIKDNYLSEKTVVIGENTQCPFKRLLLGVSMIKTKYIKVCSDDDLFSIEKINYYIEFLEKNSDYVSCQGLSLACDPTREIGRPESVRPTYASDNNSDRLCEMFCNYGHFFYSVFRTEILMNSAFALRENTEAPIGINTIELSMAMLSCIQGKCMNMSEVFLIRDPLPSQPWYWDLIIGKQAGNINSVLEYIYQRLKKGNALSNNIQQLSDLHLWFQKYLFNDTTGMNSWQMRFIEKNVFSKCLYENEYKIRKDQHVILQKISLLKKKPVRID